MSIASFNSGSLFSMKGFFRRLDDRFVHSLILIAVATFKAVYTMVDVTVLDRIEACDGDEHA